LEQIEGRIIDGLLVFTATEVLSILELETERLRQWIKLKYVEPSIPATGSGTKNYFSEIDICKIAVFKKLVDSGVNRWIGKQIIQEFSDEAWSEIEEGSYPKYLFIVVKAEDRKSWKDSMELFISPRLPEELEWEIVIIINFALITKKIKNRIW
jgi:hypothetical protein